MRGVHRDFDDRQAGQRLVLGGDLGVSPQLGTGDRLNSVYGPIGYNASLHRHELEQALKNADLPAADSAILKELLDDPKAFSYIDRLDGDLTVDGRPVRLRKPAWMGEDVLPSSNA